MIGHQLYVKETEYRGKTFADKVAITYMREDGSKTYTSYKQVADGCRNVKDMFEKHGIVAGDRVAVISPHSPQAVLATLGCAYANVTTVLIDASLPESEINRLLDFSDVRGVFTTEKIFELIKGEKKKKYHFLNYAKKKMNMKGLQHQRVVCA